MEDVKMRFVIVIVIATVFGGVIGGLIARGHLNNKLIKVTRERDQFEENNKHISKTWIWLNFSAIMRKKN